MASFSKGFSLIGRLKQGQQLGRLAPWSAITGGLLLASLVIWLLAAAQPASSQESTVLAVAGSGANTEAGGETTYFIELLNRTDQIVYDGILTMTLPAGFSYVPGSTIALGEGWPLESREPINAGQTLIWGPYHLPAAGNRAHNPYGIHTLMHGCVDMHLHLEGAKTLIGNGGYVTQLFYGIDAATTAPSQCAINFVSEAYARNLIPILRLEGHFVDGVWQAPSPGSNGDYAQVAQGFANFVAGLPRRNTNPLYIQVWNEPDLWIEWSRAPNATQYARFFVAVSNAIRRLGDGRIRIINGALTPGNPTFIDRMLRVPGFRDAFDAWSSHCYPYNHPAWYNRHAGTARYPTYAIDCYLEELAVIRRYGRSNVKVILTETGYELGNNTFGFEGFPAINQTNRAQYIANAFSAYWQKWPEVIAVTPFQMSDTSGHWFKFDWIYPTPPYLPHLQYTTVASLTKPTGGLEPYGYQIIFKARVDPTVAPGVYTGQLAGSERSGSTVFEPAAAPVEVYAPGVLQWTYLPLVLGPVRRDGPWYLAQPEMASPGAIVPTDFLKPVEPSGLAPAATPEVTAIELAGEPQALALVETAGLAAVLLADGRLETIDLARGQSRGSSWVGRQPQLMLSGGPQPAQVFVSLENEVALVDLATGQVAARWSGTGRWRGVGWDAATQRLFVADAANDRLVVLKDDLSQQLAELPLDRQPDQLLFDPRQRRLYISFPAEPQVIALDVDSLNLAASASLRGGPILELSLDESRQRLYVLNILAPAYRGLAVLETPTLRPLALAAGDEAFPFQTASTLALTPAGQLIVPESTGLWQIRPADDYSVSNLYPGYNLSLAGAMLAGQPDGTIYWLEPPTKLLKIFR